jgi:hypothetical protein
MTGLVAGFLGALFFVIVLAAKLDACVAGIRPCGTCGIFPGRRIIPRQIAAIMDNDRDDVIRHTDIGT